MRDFDTAIDFIIRALNAIPRFMKEGITPQTLMVALPLLFYIFKFQAFKNRLDRYFPGLIKKNGEPVNPVYVGNQLEIKHNLARLLAKEGMEWESADTSQAITPPSTRTHAAGTIYLRLAGLAARIVVRRGKWSNTNSTMRRKNMRNYLKKLGSRKFQAFLLTTITNLLTLYLLWSGEVDVDAKIQQWVPGINLFIQLAAGAIYMWVEGKVDKANAVAYSDPGAAE